MSPNPTWALNTIDPTCIVMGIEFGSGENTLYVLGFQDGIDVFFLKSSDGSFIWSFKLLNSVNPGNNYINFNQITTTLDMIVFTAD